MFPVRRFLNWLPLAVLLLVAANHAYLRYVHNLSPWLGAGFGMFSTTDSVSARQVEIGDHQVIALCVMQARFVQSLQRGQSTLGGGEMVYPQAMAFQHFAGDGGGGAAVFLSLLNK